MRSPECQDITSTACLDYSLKNAKNWCKKRLPQYIAGLTKAFDYEKFHYVINDDTMGSDMRFYPDGDGRIEFSQQQLRWLEEREVHMEEQAWPRRIQVGNEIVLLNGGVEVDPESMFVHEIAEFVIINTPQVLLQYMLRFVTPHEIAREIENVNRTDRSLKPWTDD